MFVGWLVRTEQTLQSKEIHLNFRFILYFSLSQNPFSEYGALPISKKHESIPRMVYLKFLFFESLNTSRPLRFDKSCASTFEDFLKFQLTHSKNTKRSKLYSKWLAKCRLVKKKSGGYLLMPGGGFFVGIGF